MKPVLFAGPSIHGVKRTELESVDILGPAACGDVVRAAGAGRRVIAIADGTFESGPAIWHKEILFAIAQGCAVLGGASMGALRAAECAVYGMIGVGRIFEDYRSGRRVSDADVALLHGPDEAGFMPLTIPIVDVDDALEQLTASATIKPTDCECISLAARSIHYKVRTWDRVFEEAAFPISSTQELKAAISRLGELQKTRDTKLLAHVATTPHAEAAEKSAFFDTVFFRNLCESLKHEQPSST